MADGINVQSNIKEFIADLDLIQRKQLPFALMKSINATLFECRKATIAHAKQTQKSNKPWWNNKSTGINRIFATKQKPTGSLTLGMYWAELAEHGGIKTPRGKFIPVPIGRIAKKYQKAGGARKFLNEKKRAFFGTMESGKEGIFVRRTKKRTPIDLAFSLVPSARIKAWLDFYKTANKEALKKFPHKFQWWLEKSIKTARK